MVDEIKQHLNNPNASGEEQFSELTSQGEIVKEKMDKAGEWLAEKLDGVKYISAPLKSFERAKEKVESRYTDNDGNPDYSQLMDITRCSFVCNTYEQMVALSERLNKNLNVIKEKDTMRVPNKATGFRNMSKNAKLTTDVSKRDISPQKNTLLVGINGHISEIQIQLKCIYDVYGKEHKIYEERRSVEAKIQKENRPATKEEAKKIKELKQASIDVYDNVLEAYNKNTKGQKIQLHREYFDSISSSIGSEKAKNVAKVLEPMKAGNIKDVISIQKESKHMEAPKETSKAEIKTLKPKSFN